MGRVRPRDKGEAMMKERSLSDGTQRELSRQPVFLHRLLLGQCHRHKLFVSGYHSDKM